MSSSSDESEYTPGDDIWSLGVILGELSGSNFQIKEGDITQFGIDNFHDLVEEAESAPALKRMISEKILTKERIATILGSRKLSLTAVAKNFPIFTEIAENCLFLDERGRSTCFEILKKLWLGN
jgi:hypothetical protein